MNEIKINEIFLLHWRKILGGILGFLVALLIIVFGFWRGFFIILCISGGVFVGWQLDAGEGLKGFCRLLKKTNSQDDF